MNSCNLPAKIGAGLTFSRLLTLPDYPATEWALVVALRGPSSINLAGQAEGAEHRLQAAAAVTAAWAPGVYWYSIRASRGAEVLEIESGQLEILPDLMAEGADFDGRTHAERTLDAITAVIEKRATLDQERYRINNRELYRTPIGDLLKLRDLYRAEVRRERAAKSGRSLFGATVRVRLK